MHEATAAPVAQTNSGGGKGDDLGGKDINNSSVCFSSPCVCSENTMILRGLKRALRPGVRRYLSVPQRSLSATSNEQVVPEEADVVIIGEIEE